jgi:glutaminyl-tRNA synthetase
VKCVDVIKDKEGRIIEVHCTYDPKTRGGDSPDGRKVKSTLHWVSAPHAIGAEVRLYDRLFSKPDPNKAEGEGKDFQANLNPKSLEVLSDCRLEPGLSDAKSCDHYQFERLGYFYVDRDSRPDRLVFNRTVALRDTWAKIERAQKKA